MVRVLREGRGAMSSQAGPIVSRSWSSCCSQFPGRTHATIDPDDYFVRHGLVLGRKEPEVQCPVLSGIGGHR